MTFAKYIETNEMNSFIPEIESANIEMHMAFKI